MKLAPGGPRRAVPEGIRITTVGLWYVLLPCWWPSPPPTPATTRSTWCWRSMFGGADPLRASLSRENVRGLEVELEPPGRGVREPAVLRWGSRSRAAPVFAALVPALHRLDGGAAPAHPLPAAAGAERGPARDDDPLAGPSPLSPCPRVEPLPLRLLPQGSALPRGPRGAGLPRDLPGRRGSRPEEPITWAKTPAGARAGGTASTRCASSATATTRGASTGSRRPAPARMIYMERESEAEPAARRSCSTTEWASWRTTTPAERFERLVSEAATAAVDHLARGLRGGAGDARPGRFAFAGGAAAAPGHPGGARPGRARGRGRRAARSGDRAGAAAPGPHGSRSARPQELYRLRIAR